MTDRTEGSGFHNVLIFIGVCIIALVLVKLVPRREVNHFYIAAEGVIPPGREAGYPGETVI